MDDYNVGSCWVNGTLLFFQEGQSKSHTHLNKIFEKGSYHLSLPFN